MPLDGLEDNIHGQNQAQNVSGSEIEKSYPKIIITTSSRGTGLSKTELNIKFRL